MPMHICFEHACFEHFILICLQKKLEIHSLKTASIEITVFFQLHQHRVSRWSCCLGSSHHLSVDMEINYLSIQSHCFHFPTFNRFSIFKLKSRKSTSIVLASVSIDSQCENDKIILFHILFHLQYTVNPLHTRWSFRFLSLSVEQNL